MNKYTIYHSTDGVLATGKPYPTDEGAEIPNLDPSLSLLLEVTEAKPTYDSATHKLVKDAVNYDTIANSATTSWSVVALTQAEIDANTPEHYLDIYRHQDGDRPAKPSSVQQHDDSTQRGWHGRHRDGDD